MLPLAERFGALAAWQLSSDDDEIVRVACIVASKLALRELGRAGVTAGLIHYALLQVTAAVSRDAPSLRGVITDITNLTSLRAMLTEAITCTAFDAGQLLACEFLSADTTGNALRFVAGKASLVMHVKPKNDQPVLMRIPWDELAPLEKLCLDFLANGERNSVTLIKLSAPGENFPCFEQTADFSGDAVQDIVYAGSCQRGELSRPIGQRPYGAVMLDASALRQLRCFLYCMRQRYRPGLAAAPRLRFRGI